MSKHAPLLIRYGAKTTPLIEDYALEGMLGKYVFIIIAKLKIFRGGFSTVFAATGVLTGDLVAIKQIEKNNEGLSNQIIFL